MSVRATEAKPIGKGITDAQLASMAEQVGIQEMPSVDVGEGSTGFQSVRAQHPLTRKVMVNVRASLAELITKSSAATWSPSEATLGSMFKQKKFTNLSGQTQMQGDLRSVVMHSVEAVGVKSSFPIAVGAQISGVDENCFSSSGKSYSMIAPAFAHTTASNVLQKDDVSVAYDFAERYPGFTADNLETNGIHQVPQRRFVLVALNHPLVTAIQENSSRLQMTDIQQMPDQLIKISTTLYNTLMPLVKDQVRAQIKVADFSRMAVSIEPADLSSWNEVSDMLTKEAVAPIKAEHKRALGRVSNDPTKTEEVNAYYQEQIEAEMTKVANTPREISVELKVEYNFLRPDGEDADSVALQ